jgi:hypothetical protein
MIMYKYRAGTEGRTDMQRNDHDAAGPAGSDFNELVTRVDSSKERRIIAHIGAPPSSGWGAAKAALILGILLVGAVVMYRQGLFANKPESPGGKTPAAVAPATPQDPANANPNDVAAIQNENEVVKAVRDGVEPPPAAIKPALSDPIPPPPSDNATSTVEKADAAGIVGQPVGLGYLAVEVENFWIDDDKKTMAYAVLTGAIQNASNTPLTLPMVEVALLDNEKRLYKPTKLAQPGSTKLNPLMKNKGTWFFELPPSTPIYCVQFSMKQGKTDLFAYVRLGGRTAENVKLMESEEYQTEFLEVMMQASPRIKAQGEYYKAKGALDRIGEQVEDAQRQITKVEKRLKIASDAEASAKAGVDKAKKESDAVKAWIKDLDASQSKFGHNQKLLDIEYGKATTQAQRCMKNEQSADLNLKEKTAARTKIETEVKEMQAKLKPLLTKYDAQEKVVTKLQEKIE